MGTIQKSAPGRIGSQAGMESLGSALARVLSQVIELAQVWYDRAAQRHALQELSDHQLKDIGLSRADAAREAMKRFWQA